MQLTRLNADSSWLIQFEHKYILLDPWLLGPQSDIFSWFSTQWHREVCAKIEDLPPIDAILISHPFTDHCHQQTLLQFSAKTPVYAASSAAKLIEKWKHFAKIIPITPHESIEIAGIRVRFHKSGSMLDLVHNALSLEAGGQRFFYAPHGFRPNKQTIDPVDVLIATDLQYDLPFLLGGTVNLGWKNLEALNEWLQPKTILLTHNENKLAKGLVAKFARPRWPDFLPPKAVHIPALGMWSL
jgi:L-ascorbate metabolism protein UlaG (beta-lactamase superfamily)